MADTPDPSTKAPDAGDKATAPTRQPADTTEGGSKGVEDPSKAAPVPPTDKPDPGVKDQPTKAAPAPTDKSAVPEKYDLKIPKDSGLDATVVERIAAHSKSRGLSQELAQSTLELVGTEIAKHREADEAAFKAKVEEWKSTADADPVLGKNREERRAAVQRGKAVIDKFGDARPDDAKALKVFLDETGFREHPAVVRFFAWLGKAAGEGPLVTGSTTDSKPKSDAELFYGPKGAKEKEAVGV